MRPIARLAVLLAVTLSLSACATARRLDAANDVHALLVSIRDEDQAAFDAHIDRESLKREIESRLTQSAAKAKPDDPWKVLGAALAPALADFASDKLIQPKVFRRVADYYGYKDGQPLPNAIAIAGSLKTRPDGKVCATKEKDGPCILVFTEEQGTWKLSGFEGDISMLRIKL